MISKIQKWGNSQGIRFPRELLKQAHVEIGDEVTVSVEKTGIVVKPTQQCRGRYKLKELLSKMPENYSPAETEWGEPVGKEVW